MFVDLVPSLSRNELVLEEAVNKQLTLESNYQSETLQKFLEHAHKWW